MNKYPLNYFTWKSKQTIYNCIYRIVNQTNNKSYIGKAKNIKQRMNRHIKAFQNGKINRLYGAFKHYGLENFYFEILEQNIIDYTENYREIYYIKKYRTYMGFENCEGYNMTLGGDGGDTLSNHSNQKEIRKKARENCKGWKQTEEYKQYMSSIRQGKDNPFYGKQHSKQQIELNRKLSMDNSYSAKIYLIISPTGIETIVTSGLRTFCKNNNMKYSYVCSKVDKGKIHLLDAIKNWNNPRPCDIKRIYNKNNNIEYQNAEEWEFKVIDKGTRWK